MIFSLRKALRLRKELVVLVRLLTQTSKGTQSCLSCCHLHFLVCCEVRVRRLSPLKHPDIHSRRMSLPFCYIFFLLLKTNLDLLNKRLKHRNVVFPSEIYDSSSWLAIKSALMQCNLEGAGLLDRKGNGPPPGSGPATATKQKKINFPPANGKTNWTLNTWKDDCKSKWR